MQSSHSSSAAMGATEQRRSAARRLITPLFLLVFATALPLSVVRANDDGKATSLAAPTPTPSPAPPPAATAAPPAPNTQVQIHSVAPPAPPAAPVSPTAGLTPIGEGGAAFYAPGYDNGGWDAIIRTHMNGGQGDPSTFPYSPEGYYCVHPDFVFGNILTLQNTDTGKTIRCTVADAVAPGDQGYWRNHFVIEISYSLFTALGLNNGNHVRVWAMT